MFIKFIAYENDTGVKFIAGDYDTGEQLSPVSLTLVIKGSLRDFRLHVFSWTSVPLAPLGLFQIFPKILGDLYEWMFTTGVNNTSDKLFTGVNDNGD